MAYEVDFIGVSEKTADSDAIAMRWEYVLGKYKIGIYDGGIQKYGDELQNILNQYYFNDSEEKVIDFVVCSHSDQDHVTGLKGILENYKVKALYMNRPWLYVDDVYDRVSDGRITKNSLEQRLRDEYKYIAELEELAQEKGIEIFEVFQGQVIADRLTVLSPTKSFYLDLMVESEKTPLEKKEYSTLAHAIRMAYGKLKELIESWNDEKLRENVQTSAENEMSVILLGNMDEERFLLTGDAGIRALDAAIKYTDFIGRSIKDNVKFIQIPHHGSRHNVSPSILNRLVGEIVEEGSIIDKAAYASAAKDSDHPLQMVVNAFIRRGVKVYKTKGSTLHHYRGTPDRGWSAATRLAFDNNVEEWED